MRINKPYTIRHLDVHELTRFWRANLFNTSFASVFSGSGASETSSSVVLNLQTCQLTLTVGEVQTILEYLDVTKATGPDSISAKLLKETASVIAPFLWELFYKSLNTGVFPQEWKEANIPIFLLSLVSNYVSLTASNTNCTT